MTVERVLALLAELASDVNRLVAMAVLNETPDTESTAFAAAERAGLIDARVAADLSPQDGPHYVLVQLHLDTEPERVAAVVSATVGGYAEYVRQVTAWTGPG